MHSSSSRPLGLAMVVNTLAMSLFAETPAPGSLDTTFGGDGIALVTLPGYTCTALCSAMQVDGSVLVAGQAWGGGPTYRAVITRFTADGELDSIFGQQGFATYGPVTGTAYAVRSLAVQSDGKILAGVDSGNSFIVLRYLSDGQLDSSFPASPRTFSSATTISALLPLAGGSYAVAAQTSATTSYLAIFQSNNELAQSRNQGIPAARALALAPGGSLYFGGRTQSDASYVGRLSSSLTDSGWGRSLNSSAVVETLTVDPFGGVLAVSSPLGNSSWRLYRITPEAAIPDPTLNGTGFRSFDLGGSGSVVKNVVSQPDARILVCGHDPQGSLNSKIVIRRFEPDGTDDAGFGVSGLVTVTLGQKGTECAGGFVRPAQNQIVVTGGGVESGFLRGLGAARLHAGLPAATPTLTITGQPQPLAAPEGSPATLSVTVTSDVEGPFFYQWYRNGAPVSSSTRELNFSSLHATDEADYYVVVRLRGASVTSDTVHLTVRRPPGITYHPPRQIRALSNDYAGISFALSGLPPITGRVLLGDTEVHKAAAVFSFNQSTFTYEFLASPGTAGTYVVEFSNRDGMVRSDPIVVTTHRDPTLLPAPAQLVAAGDGFVLSPEWIGSAEPRFSWHKDGKVLPGFVSLTYSREAAKLSDAGAYTLKGSSLRGSAVSGPITVSVVDAGERRSVGAVGKEMQLSIPFSSIPALRFQWYKDESTLLENRSGLTGTDQATLRFSALNRSDAGSYSCEIRLGDTMVKTGPQTLTIAESKPSLPSVIPMVTGYVRRPYRVTILEDPAITQLHIKGLPKGISYKADPHSLEGIPRPTRWALPMQSRRL